MPFNTKCFKGFGLDQLFFSTMGSAFLENTLFDSNLARTFFIDNLLDRYSDLQP